MAKKNKTDQESETEFENEKVYLKVNTPRPEFNTDTEEKKAGMGWAGISEYYSRNKKLIVGGAILTLFGITLVMGPGGGWKQVTKKFNDIISQKNQEITTKDTLISTTTAHLNKVKEEKDRYFTKFNEIKEKCKSQEKQLMIGQGIETGLYYTEFRVQSKPFYVKTFSAYLPKGTKVPEDYPNKGCLESKIAIAEVLEADLKDSGKWTEEDTKKMATTEIDAEISNGYLLKINNATKKEYQIKLPKQTEVKCYGVFR